MKNLHKLRLCLAFGLMGTVAVPFYVRAATAPPSSGLLLDLSKGNLGEFASEGATAVIGEEKGAKVVKATFPAGNYPAFIFPGVAGGWDLSKYAGVQVDLTNTGTTSITVALRVDNAGDWKKEPWNTESVTVGAGQTKTLKVNFGRSYGNPGFALDATNIAALKMFAVNPKQETTVIVSNLKAFGTATPITAVVATGASAAPAGGKPGPLFDISTASADAFRTAGNTTVTIVDEAGTKVVQGAFPAGKGYPDLDFPTPAGGWKTAGSSGVQADLTNKGTTPLYVAMRVDEVGNWQHNNSDAFTLKPGETKTLKVTFGKSHGNAGYALDSSKVGNIKVFVVDPKEGAVVQVKNLQTFGTSASTTAPVVTTGATGASTGTPGAIFNVASADTDAFKTDGGTTLKMVESGGAKVLQAEFAGGEGYPSLDFPVPVGGWKTAGTAGVQAELTNTGTTGLYVGMRVDEAGNWQHNNADNIGLKPGETKTLKVTFGRSYGNPGFALDSGKVGNIKVLATNPKAGSILQIKSLQTFGTAGASTTAATTTTPARTTPVAATTNVNAPAISGELLNLDKADLATFQTQESSISVANEGGAPALKTVFQAGANYPNVQFPVPKGGWNLSAFGGVQVDVTNNGPDAVTAALRVDNAGDWKQSPWNTESVRIPAGQTKTIQVRFGKSGEGDGYPLDSSRVSAVQVFLIHPKKETPALIRNLKGFGSPPATGTVGALTSPNDRNIPVTVPAWVGTKPPVDGNWVQTLNDNFDGTALNAKYWMPRDPQDSPLPGQDQRYSFKNVKVENGLLKIKTEKLEGPNYDDPKNPSRPYTSGMVSSFGKWTQAYGYFEARIKVPTARGLWPAFWMMPDRGEQAGIWWKRQATENGGMEIDILEHLTEWGPGRNNVAVHWDGYGDKHKQWGNANIYYGPTPDGFHVYGALWEPGKITWYIDGKKTAEFASESVGTVPGYFMINVQMGSWATKDVDLAKLPDDYIIDYVRCWQLKDRIKN